MTFYSIYEHSLIGQQFVTSFKPYLTPYYANFYKLFPSFFKNWILKRNDLKYGFRVATLRGVVSSVFQSDSPVAGWCLGQVQTWRWYASFAVVWVSSPGCVRSVRARERVWMLRHLARVHCESAFISESRANRQQPCQFLVFISNPGWAALCQLCTGPTER